jgi:hypothetical protein
MPYVSNYQLFRTRNSINHAHLYPQCRDLALSNAFYLLQLLNYSYYFVQNFCIQIFMCLRTSGLIVINFQKTNKK